ncbi:MAG: Trk system potassium transporter TrkA [Planktomarina sp.]
MKVIICGAGQVGWQIAKHLAKEKNDVTVIDQNPSLVTQATDAMDVQGVTGFASYPDVLAEAGAGEAEMIIAATQSDEVNMVTCQVAHSVFGVPRKIARLRTQSYLDAIYADLYRRDHLPIDVVISPEKEVAEAALKRLATPSAFETEFFLGGAAQLIGLHIDDDCPIVNTPLRQLTELFSTLRVIVVGLRRDGVLFAPEAGDQIFPSDEAYLFVHNEDTQRVIEVFGKSTDTQERVTIIGGGNIGLEVAKRLETGRKKIRTKVIERNRETAERAADNLEKTVVLYGDGLDSALLEEAQIGRTDAILAVTDDDKTNVLAAVRAKALGCKLAVCLVNDPTLVPLLSELDIDAHISPRSTTVSSILRHIRHGRVQGVYSIGDSEAEIIEARVLSTSGIAGQRVRDVGWPEGVLIGAIRKGNEVVIPKGDALIEEGNSVAIFALSEDVEAVEKLLQVAVDYF